MTDVNDNQETNLLEQPLRAPVRRLWNPGMEPSCELEEARVSPISKPTNHVTDKVKKPPKRKLLKGKTKAVIEAKPATGSGKGNIRYSPTIKEIVEIDRPRERLDRHGAAALTTAELMGIVLRCGNDERSSVALAEHMIFHFGSVTELASASFDDLKQIKGIGPAKAAEIKAAIELGRRVAACSQELRPTISGPRDVYNLVSGDLRYSKKEIMKSLLLDIKNHVLRTNTVSIGDLSSSIAHPREIFKDAVAASAHGIIVVHNHPSGDPSPSPEDVAVTKRLLEAGKTLGIELIDHIVIGDDKFVSLKERGLF